MSSTKSLTAGLITRRTKSMFVMTAVLMSSFLVLAYSQPSGPTGETTPPTVTILSPFAVLEPSTKNNPNDKDGFPPSQSEADPEEIVLMGRLNIPQKIYDVKVTLYGYAFDDIKDLTTDNDNYRNIDLLDGLNDGALKDGVYYLYWNLNKTGYVPVNTTPGSPYDGSNSASISVVGDIDKFQLELNYSESPSGLQKSAPSELYPITMEKSASMNQQDLNWLDTEPEVVYADVGDSFSIRGKYAQSSSQGLQWMIIQSYYNGRVLRLNEVSLYYYNNHEPGTIKDGVPTGYDKHWHNQTQYSETNLGDTDNKDYWVTEYNFTVMGDGSSDVIPYIQTIKKGDNWKIDTGYVGFKGHVPGGVNPAKLSISKYFTPGYPNGVVSGPNPPVVGETTTYSIDIKVKNVGEDKAVNVFVYDTVQLDNVVWTDTYTVSQGSIVFDPVTGKISWNVGTLNPDVYATLTYQVGFTPTEDQLGQQVMLNAGATTTGKSYSSGATITDGPTPPLYTFACVGFADMEITKSGSQETADPSDEITYTLHYFNQGHISAYNVVVKDTIPDHVTFVSCSDSCSTADDKTYTWNIGIVPAGGSDDVTITVKVDEGVADGTVLTNVGRVEFTNSGGTPQPPDEDTFDVTVTAPVMAFSKSVDVTTADPGDLLTYTLRYENKGSGMATGVVIIDELPAEVTFVSSTPDPTPGSCPDCEYVIGDVDPGEIGSITIVVQVKPGTPDKTVIRNLATIYYDDNNGNEYPPEEEPAETTVTAPIIDFDKEVDKTQANPGDVITYTLTAKNLGTGVATGIVLKDTIPSATTFVSAVPGYSGKSGKSYWWNRSCLAAGETFTVTLKVSVNPYTADGTVLTNTAIFYYKDANGNPYEPEPDTATTTVTAPVMTFDKTADKEYATPGDQITYEIIYENTGTGKATEVFIVDTLPDYVTVVSISPLWTGHPSEKVYEWDIGAVNGGDGGTITIVVKVNAGAPDGAVLKNVAKMGYADANGNDYPQMEDSTSTTVKAPDMAFSKTADVSTADPGDIITYSLHYKNEGTGSATDIVIKDTIPSDTTFVDAVPWYSDVVDSTYIWKIDEVASDVEGDIILKVQVRSGTSDGTILLNTATLDYDDANGNPCPQLPSSATTTVTAPSMTFTKTADKEYANPGDTIMYTLYYNNAGDGLAKNVVIKDTIPSYVTFVTSDHTYSWDGDRTYTFDIGDVPGNTDGAVKIWVTVDPYTPDETPLSNSATFDYTDANGNPLDQLDDSATTCVTAPEFTFSKEADVSYADPGDIITYTITYKNTGTGGATDVNITDTIPLYVTLISANPAYTYQDGRTYSWIFPTIGSGVGGTIIIKVSVDPRTADKTVLTNTATLYYEDVNGNGYPKIPDCASTTVTAPVVTLGKVADVNDADPGDTVTYTITYKNSGTGVATLVVIIDTLPSQMTFVDADPYPDEVDPTGHILRWNIGDMTAGAGNSITVEAKVNVGTPDGTVLSNKVALDYADANGNYYDQLKSQCDVIVTAPVMTFSKEADVTTANPGDYIVYTLHYDNEGSGWATDIVIIDTLPDHVDFIDATPDPDDVSGNVLTWYIDSVAPYSGDDIAVTVQVQPYTDDGTYLVNKATLDYNDANGNPLDQECGEAQVTVTAPIMHMTKDANVTKADPGDFILYTITYWNSGSGAASEVVVTDTIPEHVLFIESTPEDDGNSGGVYHWDVGTVGAGGNGEITIKVQVKDDAVDATVLHNVATLDYADANGNGYDQLSDCADVTVTAPVVDLTKTADVTTADPGDYITYTIKFVNSGGGNATEVYINDTIPDHVIFDSCTPPYLQVDGRTYTWYWSLVLGGDSVEVEVKVKVDFPVADKTLLHNYATGDYRGDNGNPYPQLPTYADVTVTVPVFSFSKSANVGTADPGDLIVYTLEWKNTGTGWASGVKVVDTISAFVEFVSSSPAPSVSSNPVYTWNLDDVAPGASGTIEITVRVLAATPDKTLVHNVATLDYKDANCNAYPQMSDYADVVVTAPVISMRKTGDVTEADPGDTITYTIYYENSGTGWAANIIIIDTLPDHVTYFDATPSPDSVLGKVLTWQIGDLGPGATESIEVIVIVDAPTADKTLLHNAVTLDFTDLNGNAYPQLQGYWDVQVTAPVMTITKTSDVTEADPGDYVVYTLHYENTGTGDASYILIVDTLPPELVFVSSIPAPFSVVGQVVTWKIMDVESMASGDVQATVQVVPGTPDKTSIRNEVYMDYYDANGNYVERVRSQTDIVVTAPVMTLEKEAGDVTVSAYVIANFTLRIAGEKWHDVRLYFYDGVDRHLAARIIRYPGSPDDQSVTIYDVKIDLLGPFQAIIEYTPPDDPINGQIWGDNPCWLTLTFPDGHWVRLKHNFNVRHEDTWIWTIDDFKPYIKGEEIIFEAHIPYTITYENIGTGDASGVVVVDTFPLGSTFVEFAPTDPICLVNVCTWFIGDVLSGEKGYLYANINYVFEVDGTTIKNEVTLDYSDANGNFIEQLYAYAYSVLIKPIITSPPKDRAALFDPTDMQFPRSDLMIDVVRSGTAIISKQTPIPPTEPARIGVIADHVSKPVVTAEDVVPIVTGRSSIDATLRGAERTHKIAAQQRVAVASVDAASPREQVEAGVLTETTQTIVPFTAQSSCVGAGMVIPGTPLPAPVPTDPMTVAAAPVGRRAV